ncbi:MAG: LemA family protein [Deltaproteobacteria bacterium]|nr:LemA family protein [Deltaproteobacteria bacterium]
MIGMLVLLGLVAAVVLTCIGIYNTLVTLRNRYKNGYSQIDVQLKRRNDLIPNLVETAKGYLKHERETLDAVVKARNQAVQAGQKAAGNPGNSTVMQGLMGAEAELSGILGRFLAVVESYPDLKANQTMLQLMEELSSTENKIGFARQAYNDAVMEYNIAREKFPNALIAGAFDFKEATLFEITAPEEKKAVTVSF